MSIPLFSCVTNNLKYMIDRYRLNHLNWISFVLHIYSHIFLRTLSLTINWCFYLRPNRSLFNVWKMSLARSKYDSRNQLYEMGTAPIQRKMFGNSLMCVFNKNASVCKLPHICPFVVKSLGLSNYTISIRRVFPITLICLHIVCTSLAYFLNKRKMSNLNNIVSQEISLDQL